MITMPKITRPTIGFGFELFDFMHIFGNCDVLNTAQISLTTRYLDAHLIDPGLYLTGATYLTLYITV